MCMYVTKTHIAALHMVTNLMIPGRDGNTHFSFNILDTVLHIHVCFCVRSLLSGVIFTKIFYLQCEEYPGHEFSL